MSEKDEGNLRASKEASEKILLFTKSKKSADELYDDVIVFDAVLMNFIVIGEAVSRLSSDLLIKYNELPWSEIKGFRNIVAHNYFGVDAEEVWQIIQNDLPSFQNYVNSILED